MLQMLESPTMERSTIVKVRDGLHARPATRFVKLAKTFESDVELRNAGKSASAKSSVKLMLLGIKENDEVTVSAAGADAAEAVSALIAYLEDPLSGTEDEPANGNAPAAEPAAARRTRSAEGVQGGVGASPGIALGPVFAYFPPQIRPENKTLAQAEIADEQARFEAAIGQVAQKLEASISPDMPAADKGIIGALRDIASDEALRQTIGDLIGGGLDAVSATIAGASRLASEFRNLDDPYLKARAEDIESVARQICLSLLGTEEARLDHIPEGSILLCEDIGAWDLARAPLKKLAGIVCAQGGATSHVAIIARTHGLPAVLGAGHAVNQWREARELGIDGDKGLVFADPEGAVRDALLKRIDEAEDERKALQAYRTVEPRGKDGRLVHIAANLGSLEEMAAAKEAGAMGVGLFRTELLFMQHLHLPSEDMQAEIYGKLAAGFAPYPVIVRTLDVGGDKPISGVEFPDEENPFLGWRGVRMCLDRPEIFKPQLRALLRAATRGNLKVMLPMVSDVEEVRRTRRLIDECKAELASEGVAHADFPLGVMIETPAAVFAAPQLAREAAFFSIGTNDLTQYVMAADRLNPNVAHLNDAAHPAVLAAIAQAARAAREAGIEIGMCGEAAARVDLIPTWLELGLTELSMSPSYILAAKKRVSGLLDGSSS